MEEPDDTAEEEAEEEEEEAAEEEEAEQEEDEVPVPSSDNEEEQEEEDVLPGAQAPRELTLHIETDGLRPAAATLLATACGPAGSRAQGAVAHSLSHFLLCRRRLR